MVLHVWGGGRRRWTSRLIAMALGAAACTENRTQAGTTAHDDTVSGAIRTEDTARALAAPRPDPNHALFGCLVGDSAVYAEVATAGAAGVTIDLWQAGDGIDGSTRPTEGAPEQSLPVASVRLTGADSVRLAMPTAAADTSVFEGRASCDSLWGVQRVPPTASPRAARYRRVH